MQRDGTPRSSDSPAAISRPELALAQIRRLRYRRRRLRLFDGLSRLAASVLLLVWASFLIDWSLSLPVAVRAVQAAAAVFLVLMALRVFVLGARRPVTDDWLASQIDSAEKLEQSLLTAVQLVGRDNPHAKLYSPYLLERTVIEAEAKARELNAAQLVSARGFAASLVLLVVLASPLAAGAFFNRDLARTYVERVVLLREIPWPRQYDFDIEVQLVESKSAEPLPTPNNSLVIAVGKSLIIKATKKRGGDARAYLHLEQSDGRRDSSLMNSKDSGQSQRFTLSNVTRDLSFFVECGDWRSSTYEINVRTLPRIESVSLSFVYPDYTGLNESVEGRAANLGGHVKVPIHTRVDFEATTSIPVVKATWVRSYRAESGLADTRVALDPSDDGLRLAGSFTADQSGSYHFELESDAAFTNTESPLTYQIAVVPDRRPTVEFKVPGRNLEVTKRARFHVLVTGQDDYGLEQGRIVFRFPDDASDDSAGKVILESSFSELSGRVKLADAEATFDLEPLALAESTFVEYFAEVADAAKQNGLSRSYRLTVVTDDELARILQDELTVLRERLEQIHDLQVSARKEVETVLQNTSDAGVASGQLPHLHGAGLDQDRVASRSDQLLERMHELIARANDNRLVWKDLPRVSRVAEHYQALIDDKIPLAKSSLNGLIRDTGDDRATRNAVLDTIALQKSVEQGLYDMLLDLREWGAFNSIKAKLREAKDKYEKDIEARLLEKLKEKH